MAGSNATLPSYLRLQWPAFAPLLLASWFAALNLFLFERGPANEPVEVLLMGAIIVQPVLFAIWMVMGPGVTLKRIPVTLASFVFVMLASGIKILDRTEQGGTHDSGFLIPGLALLLLMAGVLWIIRWRTGGTICRLSGTTSDNSPTNQFSLKFLLAAMTICAVILIAVRDLIPQKIGPLSGNGLIMTSISLALFLLILVPAIYIPLAVLAVRRFNRLLLLAPFLWGVLIWLTIEIVVATSARFRMMPRDRSEIISLVIFAQAGAVIVAIVSASILRFAGYQLGKATPMGCEPQIPDRR